MNKKIVDELISEEDILDFVENHTDLSFELSIKRFLNKLGLPVQHAGHYHDPVTGKSREFDFRARIKKGNLHLAISLEVKNLRKNFPLVAICVPREKIEAKHAISKVRDIYPNKEKLDIISLASSCMESRMSDSIIIYESELYPSGAPVARLITQIGKSERGDKVSANSDIYEKWGQALSSMDDMVAEFEDLIYEPDNSVFVFAAALPIVVVPDGTLWSVEYSIDGIINEKPSLVDRVSFFCDFTIKDKRIPAAKRRPDFYITHVEFMTVSGLKSFISDVMNRLESCGIFPVRNA